MELSTPEMTKEQVIENLKTMVFGQQAFKRFNTDERETISLAWKMLEKQN